MCVGMEGVRLQSGFVFQQPIENVDRLPDPAGNKMAEQRDISVTNVMIRNPAKAAIANVTRPQEVIFEQCDMGAVRNRGLTTTPQKREFKPDVCRLSGTFRVS